MINTFLPKALLSMAAILPFSQDVFASDLPPKPQACPSFSAIQAAGVNMASESMFGWVAINFKNKLETKDDWTIFAFAGARDIKDESEAIAKGNSMLATLDLTLTPNSPSLNGRQWECYYVSEGYLYAWVITPAGGPG